VAIAGEKRPTRRAELLDALAQLAIVIDPLAVSTPKEPAEPIDVLDLVDEHGNLRPITIDKALAPPLVDAAEAISAWRELSSLLDDARLFPVAQLSKRLAVLAPLLIDQPGWRSLIDTVDAAVGASGGSAAVAAVARDRGVALREAGRYRDALREMHTAKVEWWQGDTLRGSLLAMLIIADCYQALRLLQAAKQHALAAAYGASIGGDDVIDLVSTGFLFASECDYLGGASFGALELVSLGLLAQSHYVDTEASKSADDQRTRAVMTLGWCLHLARRVAPRFVPFVEQTAKTLGFYEGLDEVDRSVPDEPRDAFLARIDDQLLGRLLSDSGTARVIRFAALGTDWTITASNRFEDARAAERFASAVQVTLVELADEDLCLIPTSIRVKVEIADDAEPIDDRIRWAASNVGREWLVRLTAYDESRHGVETDAFANEVLVFLTQILIDASLLPQEAFLAALEDAFRRGLSHKLTSVRPFDELGIPRDLYDRAPRALVYPPADPTGFRTQDHAELEWESGVGPTYDRDEALDMIRRRYELTPKAIPNLLGRLRADAEFAEVVVALRQHGWRDWHILLAVNNAALNDKLRREDVVTDRAEAERRTQEWIKNFDLDEDRERPIAFTVDEMQFHRRMTIPLALRGYGLSLHQPTPDFDAIDRFLGERYGYWEDDVEHEDLFPLASETAPPGDAAAIN
jgi:hypothetical protein